MIRKYCQSLKVLEDSDRQKYAEYDCKIKYLKETALLVIVTIMTCEKRNYATSPKIILWWTSISMRRHE